MYLEEKVVEHISKTNVEWEG